MDAKSEVDSQYSQSLPGDMEEEETQWRHGGGRDSVTVSVGQRALQLGRRPADLGDGNSQCTLQCAPAAPELRSLKGPCLSAWHKP
eukprot:1280968-Amphidinium_carterae.1